MCPLCRGEENRNLGHFREMFLEERNGPEEQITTLDKVHVSCGCGVNSSLLS
jgi:hypothetical protein